MKTLIIAEKNSVMKKLVKALANDKPRFDKGYAESKDFIFTHCVGHLLTLKMPDQIDEKYKKWSLENLPFNFEEIPLQISKSVKEQFNVVKKLMLRNDVAEIVDACDPDREGELIFRNLLYYVNPNIKKHTRMWIETTESDEALQKTFESRLDGSLYDNLYKAAKARQYADYLIGLTSTEGMSVVFGNGKPLTIGRVQTPTLKIIVDREKEILNFISKPFYKILAHTDEEIDGNYINPELEDNRFYNKEECEKEVKNIGLGKAIITDVLIEQRKDKPRLLYNLSDLQVEMSKRHKMSAQTVLDCCQSLYETHGLTTYPRTSENRISFELAEKQMTIVNNLPDSLFDRQKTDIKSNKYVLNSRVIAKKDIGSHEALTPVAGKKVDDVCLSKLSADELKVYEAICERFLSNFYPDAVYEKQTITFEKNNRKFQNSITNLVYPGHFLAYKHFKEQEQTEFIKVNKGDELQINELEILEGKTEPPARFSEGTLIKVMISPLKYVQEKEEKDILKETEGIGTEATRASIIETLKKQEYIEIKKGIITPTSKGMKLIDLIPSDTIKSVSLTAKCEKSLSEIAKGECVDSDFLKTINEMNEKFINNLKEGVKNGMYDVGDTIELKEQSNNQICQCPICGGDVIESKFGFYCKNKCGLSLRFQALEYLKGPKINKTMAKELILNGKTKKEYKFISKKNTPYQAYVTYKFEKEETYPNKFGIEFSKNH